MKFSGPMHKLKRWEAQLKAASHVMPKLSEQLSEEAIDLVKDGMKRGVDPHGKRYKRLVLREGTPLSKTGGLKASWHRRYSNSSGFAIYSGKKYAIYHQRGTGVHGPSGSPIKPRQAKALKIPGLGYRKIVKGSPRRAMVPYRNRLPIKWRRAFAEAAEEVLAKHFK